MYKDYKIMKSKTAEDLLGCSYDGGHVLMENAERAVEIAEQETEERVRAELTRWHDPKEELPEPLKNVLVKRQDGSVIVDMYLPDIKMFDCEIPHYMEVVGWREIHE